MRKPGDFWRQLGGWTLKIGGPILLLICAVAFFPMRVPELPEPRATPLTYEEADKVFRDIVAAEPIGVNEVCFPKLLHHGHPTQRVYVLLHGLSNCPAQFEQIGAALHKAGHTVLIPRMPHHGMKDRLTDAYGKLTLQEMATWIAGNLELARALGNEVIVSGLSVNGTTVSWVAQKRGNLTSSVVISPFYGPAGIPDVLQAPLGRLLARLPNVFIWWDASKKQDIPGPSYAYPRFPTRVVGEFMVLGQAVLANAKKSAPMSPNLWMVWSEADPAISLTLIQKMTARWKAWPTTHLQEKIFPLDLGVPHDMVDPHQPDQKTSITDPALMQIFQDNVGKN